MCGQCKWYLPKTEESGECVRFPPCGGQRGGYTEFPTVHPKCRCGEFALGTIDA